MGFEEEGLQVLIYVLKKITLTVKKIVERKKEEEKVMKRCSYISLLFAFLDPK